MSKLLDDIEADVLRDGVRNMTFEFHIPEMKYVERGEDSDNVFGKTAILWGLSVSIDDGKIDYEFTDYLVSLLNKKTGNINIFLNKTRVNTLRTGDFLTQCSFDPKTRTFVEDLKSCRSHSLSYTGSVCKYFILPLVNEQLRTGEEKFFSRNGVDLLVEEAQYFKQLCDEVSARNRGSMYGLMLRENSFPISQILGRPGDTSHTKHSILVKKYNEGSIPKTVNRLPLALGDVVANFCKIFPKEHIGAMMSKPVLANALGSILYKDAFFLEEIFASLFYSKAGDYHLAENYLSRCIKEGWKADITLCRNESTAHDRLVAADRKAYLRQLEAHPDMSPDAKLKIRAPYRKLAEKIAPLGYRLLESDSEMIMEGEMNRNCVGSYIRTVNSGMCAIFTKESPHCTIEVNFIKDMSGRPENHQYNFICPQYYGFANSFPPEIQKEKEQFDNILKDYSREYNQKLRSPRQPKLLSIEEKQAKKEKKAEKIKERKDKFPKAIRDQHARYGSKFTPFL